MSREEKTENITGPCNIENDVEEGYASGFLSRGDWPKNDWWKEFQSKELTTRIEEAFEKNPDLRSIASRIQVAKERATVARSKLFPYLFFNADDSISYFSKNGLDHAFNPSLPLHGYEIDISLSFSYEFDFWGKYRNLFRAALGEELSKTAELAQAKLVTATALSQSYFALQTSYKKQEILKRLCQVRKYRFDLQNKLREGALSSLLPPLTDAQQVHDAEERLLEIENEIRVQEHSLNILSGRSPSETVNRETVSEGFLPSLSLPETISIDLLARRPDLAASLWQVESLAALVGAAKADFFPNINLNAFLGVQSLHVSDLFSSSSETGNVTPALHLPIFTAGAIRGRLREQKARFDEAVFRYDNLILESAKEVTDVISGIRAAFAQKLLTERSLLDARDRLNLFLLRKEGGLDSEFSVLEGEEEVLLRTLSDLDMVYMQYALAIRLIRSLGGGYAGGAS